MATKKKGQWKMWLPFGAFVVGLVCGDKFNPLEKIPVLGRVFA